MNLNLYIIVQKFKKIITLNVNILKSSIELVRKTSIIGATVINYMRTISSISLKSIYEIDTISKLNVL